MGGGGGFDPISSVISTIFTSVGQGLLSQSPREAPQAPSAPDTSAQDGEAAVERARREDQEQADHLQLLQARQARARAEAQESAQAQTLGAPQVERAELKEKLGQ